MKTQRLRLKNEEQLKGAEMMLDYINQWANEDTTLYNLRFRLLLEYAELQSIQQYFIRQQIESELATYRFYDDCPMSPCEQCVNQNCIRWYEVEHKEIEDGVQENS